jgi:hypothetical protein
MNGGIEKIYTMPYLNSVIVCLLPTTLLIYNYVLVLQISHTLLLPEMLLVPPQIGFLVVCSMPPNMAC